MAQFMVIDEEEIPRSIFQDGTNPLFISVNNTYSCGQLEMLQFELATL